VNNLLRRFSRHRPDGDAISTWLDGALDPPAAAALEAHVAACDACRARAGELRAVRASLAALPRVDPPRSFRLHPSQLAAPAPRRPYAPSPWMRYAPAVSAAAMVVFAVLVGVDITRTADDSAPGMGGFARTLSDDSSEMAAAPAERSATDTVDPAAAGAAAEEAVSPDAATSADGDDTAFSGATPSAPAPEEQIAAITRESGEQTAEAVQLRDATDDDDAGVSWLRVAEVTAAAVALIAALYAATSFRRRRLNT
jgi:hypothetical protein